MILINCSHNLKINGRCLLDMHRMARQQIPLCVFDGILFVYWTCLRLVFGSLCLSTYLLICYQSWLVRKEWKLYVRSTGAALYPATLGSLSHMKTRKGLELPPVRCGRDQAPDSMWFINIYVQKYLHEIDRNSGQVTSGQQIIMKDTHKSHKCEMA